MPGDIRIASTTDSQDDVNRAAGLAPESKPEAEQEAQPQPAPAPVAEEAKPETEQPAAEPEEKPSKGGFQRRIDKLTRRNYELEEMLERQSARFEDALRALETSTRGVPQQQPAAAPDKPTPDKFRTYEEFMEAMVDYKANQKIEAYQQKVREEQEAQSAQREQQRLQTVFQDYNRNAAVFREEHDDWEQVVGQNMEIPAAVQLAIFELPNGPAVAYHLGQNPELCEKLMGLSDLHAVMEVSRISDNLGGGGRSATAPNGTANLRRPVSNAPAPITPVGGSRTSGSSVPLDELPYREYRKIRDEQQRNRYKR